MPYFLQMLALAVGDKKAPTTGTAILSCDGCDVRHHGDIEVPPVGHTMISGPIMDHEKMRRVMSECLARVTLAGWHIERDDIQRCPRCLPPGCRANSETGTTCTCWRSGKAATKRG